MQHQVIAELILSTWPDLTEEQLQLIIDNINVKEIKKNCVVYDAGDLPEQLAFIIEGKVKIYKNTPGNRCQILRIAKKGDFFGYTGQGEQSVILRPGNFLVVFPGDAHRLRIPVREPGEAFTRVVFKIKAYD